MSKGKIIGIIAIILILLLGMAFGIVYYKVTHSEEVPAQLVDISGTVLVNGVLVNQTTPLKQTDAILVQSGSASVVLFESIIVVIPAPGEVVVSDLSAQHPKVTVNSGTTWNKFLHIVGIPAYSTQAGNTVASVRGTGFLFSKSVVAVDDGVVAVNNGTTSVNLEAGDAADINGTITTRPVSDAEKSFMASAKSKTIAALQKLRELEILKHPKIANYIKDKYQLADEQIASELESLDHKTASDVDKLVAQSPVSIESVNKIAIWTKEIQNLTTQ